MQPTIASLRRALEHAESYLESLPERHVASKASVEQLRQRLDVGLQQHGVDPQRVLDELVAGVDEGLLASGGGRFFAWVIGGALPSALAVDWLTSTWDQNAAMGSCAPGAAVVEELAGTWFKELLGLPREASFAFTTGCQMAHFTALCAARHALLARAGWDVNEEGLFGAPRMRVLTSDCRHGSVDRALRFLGLGRRQLISVRSDGDGRVDPRAFEAALRSDSAPTVVVLDAADLNIGACDPFETLIPMAQEAGAWVHIDGAFGLFALASREKRELVKGVLLADSWATDAHKWLNVPFDCGAAFVRDARAHREAMNISASYLVAEGELRDQIDWNPEWSRRARGFPVYAALRELGRDGVESMVDRCCGHAVRLVQGLAQLPGVEVLWHPTLNQGLVRFLDPGALATEAQHDARTDFVIEAVNASGEAFFSPTTWRGLRAMRISVVNWQTTEEDVRRSVEAVAEVLGRA